MLSVVNLVKKYGDLVAVSNVSFDLDKGEAAALLGPNGAGKSTLIKCILGLLDYAGEIKVDGENIKLNPKETRSRISYVPQEPALYDITVSDTLGFFARLRKVDPEKTEQVLRRVGLSEHRNKLTSELSGGLKQRLSFAIALLSEVRLLILDEPTSNLDRESRNEILFLIGELREKGYTILFSSHRVDEVMQVADKVIFMNDGKIVAVDNIDGRGRESETADVRMVLEFEEGLVDIASAVLRKEGFYNLKKEKNSLVLGINRHEKIIPIQKLLGEEIIIKDFYVEQADLS
ncbi:MAG: ABC transporter ATP-binding protein [Candidatus Dadabacteria bacterium]|nr:ABC transporter ATP-binding protein [Candidatus Dadabacteria bacterium]